MVISQRRCEIHLEDRPVASCSVNLREIARLIRDYGCPDPEEVKYCNDSSGMTTSIGQIKHSTVKTSVTVLNDTVPH